MVPQARASAFAIPAEQPARSAVLAPWKPIIGAWLAGGRRRKRRKRRSAEAPKRRSAEAPKKQRHTAGRVWQRLAAEFGADVDEPTLRRFVAEGRSPPA